jgi:hypothetical protein
MKSLDKNELYENLTGFLKGKGIELREGTYAQAIQKSCALLSDAINLGQDGLERAKTQIDTKLDQLRQVVHQKTAPKSASTKVPPRKTGVGMKKGANPAGRKTRSGKPRKSRS